MLKALVFDFDGVIVDTETQWYYIYRDWLKRTYHYDLSIQDYLVCVGSSSERLFAFLKQELGTDEEIRKFEKRAMTEYIRRTQNLPAMEGVRELVTAAKARGLHLAIATSATRKKPQVHLERLQLIEYFDVFSTAELSRHIKPAPDIFLKAAELLGCLSTECLAVEDSRNGLIAASRAGMPCLIVPNKITESSDFTGCYRKLSSLKELNLEELIADFQSS